MKPLKPLLAGIALSFSLGARADLVEVGAFTPNPDTTNPASEAAWIEQNQGLESGALVYLNKYQFDENSWENDGVLPSSHFGYMLTEDLIDLVSWDLTGTGYQLAYVLVKAANSAAVGNVGGDTLRLYGVTPDQVFTSNGYQEVVSPFGKRFSHVSFFGVPGGGQVPDAGASLVLLATGLLGLGAMRRRLP